MKKTEVINLRVTPEEKEIIKRKADTLHKSVSEYLKDLVFNRGEWLKWKIYKN